MGWLLMFQMGLMYCGWEFQTLFMNHSEYLRLANPVLILRSIVQVWGVLIIFLRMADAQNKLIILKVIRIITLGLPFPSEIPGNSILAPMTVMGIYQELLSVRTYGIMHTTQLIITLMHLMAGLQFHQIIWYGKMIN